MADDGEFFVSGQAVTLRFCSQAHLTGFVGSTNLPFPPAGESTRGSGLIGTVSSALLVAVVLAGLTGSLYGFWLLVERLTG